MERAGLRYKKLASRCREFAIASEPNSNRSALLRMGEAYDRRADELECEWQETVENAGQTALPLSA
jgi:hypothetical protein